MTRLSRPVFLPLRGAESRRPDFTPNRRLQLESLEARRCLTTFAVFASDNGHTLEGTITTNSAGTEILDYDLDLQGANSFTLDPTNSSVSGRLDIRDDQLSINHHRLILNENWHSRFCRFPDLVL